MMPVGIDVTVVLPLIQGFMLCASLIIAIGPQNLFILRQGLRRRHLFTTAFLCTLVDLGLIGLGVGGFGAIIAATDWLLIATNLGGAAFLLGYGLRAFRSACVRQPVMNWEQEETGLVDFKGTILATLSFSLLNPAAYVDTLLMIGTASGRYHFDERLMFGIGAVMASGIWFFTLTYGASCLTSLFRRPAAWRLMDIVSGCMMVGIAGSLSTPHLVWLW